MKVDNCTAFFRNGRENFLGIFFGLNQGIGGNDVTDNSKIKSLSSEEERQLLDLIGIEPEYFGYSL